MKTAAVVLRMLTIASMALALCASPLALQPTSAAMLVWRVTVGGATSGACGDTWATACDLQYALTSVATAPGEMWVQQGTYLPTSGTDQTASFVLRTGISIYGGFEGDENDLSERDYATYVTTLSGNIGDAGISSDNSYHVVSAPEGIGNSAVLDGFTITAGDAGALSGANSNGAGIYVYRASPTLTNLVITGNAAWLNGGGIYNYQGDPKLSYLVITANRALHGAGMHSFQGVPDLDFVDFVANIASASGTASSLGGGMYNYDSDPTLSYVTFSSNSAAASALYAGYGGGMYNDISNPTLTDVTFDNNSTPVFSVGDPAAGGGMYNADSSPTLTDVDFSGNGSTQGAGMMNAGGAPQLTDVTFSSNTATGKGGGIYNSASAATLARVTFAQNDASDGAGLYNTNGSPTLTDVTFYANQATNYGGGMYNDADGAVANPVFNKVTFESNQAVFAGALANDARAGGTASPTLTNVTFSGNTSNSNAGAMSITATGAGSTASPTLAHVTFSLNDATAGSGGAIWASASSGGTIYSWIWNSIFWGDTAGSGLSVKEFQAYGGQLFHIRHSILEQGCQTWFADCAAGDPDPNGHNLSSNPGLLSMAYNGGFNKTMAIAETSIAVDKADADHCPLTDQREVSRPQPAGGVCDIGAYEFLVVGPLCRVDDSATGMNTGVSWIDAFTTLQAALETAACEEIWVAAGLYTPTDDRTLPEAAFEVASGTEVYGGFAGAESDSEFHLRDIAANRTVLSGDITGNDNSGSDGIAASYAEILGPNSYHVVMLDGATVAINNDTVLDGFVITAGTANGTDLDGYGGGLLCIGAGGSTGGICSPTLANLTLSGNQAVSGGGAIFIDAGEAGQSRPVITGSTFVGNKANQGGAIADSTYGGGVSSPIIAASRFSGNQAIQSGGALYNNGYGGTSHPVVHDSVFYGNTATAGGAVFNISESGGGYVDLINVTMSGNSATYEGGAIFSTVDVDPDPAAISKLSNSIVWGNDASLVPHIANFGATIDISYSDVEGGCSGSLGCNFMTGNYDSDPQFESPSTGDLRVRLSSPIIDAGNNDLVPAGVTTDILGNPRFFDVVSKYDAGWGTAPIVDMGAHEYWVDCPTGPITYVDQDATGTGSGDSWTDAFTDLAGAREAGPMCSATSEYWVAEGVYLPGNFDASDTFRILDGMQVYGGFDGSETARDERDVKANVTILSGDIDGDDDSNNADGNFIAEHPGEIVGENPYHIVTIDGGETVVNSTNTVLDGFTITGGYAAGVGKDAFGGGLYCFGACDATCSPTLQNLVFSGNYATEGGGGLANDGQGGESSPVINNVTFAGNWAGMLQPLPIGAGGAIINRGQGNYEGIGKSNPIITNSTFIGNRANLYGGAIYNDGTHDGESSPVVSNSTFVGNESEHYGGAVFNHAWDLGRTEASYANVTFWGNSATNGGGSMATDDFEGGSANVPVTNSIFWGGSATSGPEVNSEGSTTIVNSVIQNAYDDSGAWLIDATEGAGNTEADPLLAPLAENGGATKTMALLAGSSAIDAGMNTSCPDYDQRGVTRPRGPQCDIGAFERPTAAAGFDDGYSSDVVVYRNGAWLFYDLNTGAALPGVWTGNPGGACIPAPLDHDGDGKEEFSQLCGGVWHFYDEAGTSYKEIWVGNVAGQRPVPADYDGNGIEDLMLFRGGAWLAYDYTTGAYLPGSSVWTGNPGGTGIPTPMDYDGDGMAERSILSGGGWHFYNNDGTYHKGIWIGNVAGQLPVPGDYDNDGTDEVMAFRGGGWLFYDFNSGLYVPAKSVWTGAPAAPLGGGATAPAPLDYDGDGTLELSVFAGGPWHFYNDNGSYNRGIWVGINAADRPISRRPLP